MKKLLLMTLVSCQLFANTGHAFNLMCNLKLEGIAVSRAEFSENGGVSQSRQGFYGPTQNVGDIYYTFGVNTMGYEDAQGKFVEFNEGEAGLQVSQVERLLKEDQCDLDNLSSMSCVKSQTLGLKIIKLSGKHQTDLSFKMHDGRVAHIKCSTATLTPDYPL